MGIRKTDLHFVLVRTRFASNLGSSVRAMKNMGFENLVLVDPRCEIGVEARAYAMKGAEILDRALFLPRLETARDRLGLLVATTGRFRQPRPSLIDCPDFADLMTSGFGEQTAGIVFGSEGNGLTHKELRLCHWLMRIPTDSDYPVMNLAQAVAVVAYELNRRLTRAPGAELLHEATAEEVANFLDALKQFLQGVRFPEHVKIDKLMHRLRRIAARARLEKEDINLLRGLLTRFGPCDKARAGNR